MLVIAYIPCGSEEEARRIGKKLVSEKLAACANIVKSHSIYAWEDELKEGREWIVLAKTLPGKFKKLQKRVEKLHSYEIPCIIGLPVGDANPAYATWVEEQVK